MFGKMLDWFRMPVARVPEDIAVCEFECGKQECRLQDWENCERRLHGCRPQAGKHRYDSGWRDDG
jgi:hypothetical protein